MVFFWIKVSNKTASPSQPKVALFYLYNPFNFLPAHSESQSPTPSSMCSNTQIPHLQGNLKFGDSLEAEWFTIFLRISAAFPLIQCIFGIPTGRGNKNSGDNFHAAPNIDRSQDFVRMDIREWLCWMREEVGYHGWRLDFVRGFWGGYVKDYMDSSKPYFAVGEYWDSLSYTYGKMDYNQDAHRQRIVDWINATSGTVGAFELIRVLPFAICLGLLSSMRKKGHEF